MTAEDIFMEIVFVVLSMVIGYAIAIFYQFWIETKLESKMPHKWAITNKKHRDLFFTGKFVKGTTEPIFDGIEKAKMYKDEEQTIEALASLAGCKDATDYMTTSFWLHESLTSNMALSHANGEVLDDEKSPENQNS